MVYKDLAKKRLQKATIFILRLIRLSKKTLQCYKAYKATF